MNIAIETVTEMITQREYKISESDDDKLIGTNSIGEQIVVFKQPVIKFNIDRVKEYINLLAKMGKNHCIVIYTDCVTPLTKKLVENSVDIKIELFTLEELQYNITKHYLVPAHSRLTPNEATDFKKKNGLKFGAMLLTDPITRFYNYQRGDVIRITKKDKDKKKYISYRIVKG